MADCGAAVRTKSHDLHGKMSPYNSNAHKTDITTRVYNGEMFGENELTLKL